MGKERPILFSGEMVKAILDGRKSQTRRVIRPQPRHRPYLQQDAFYVKGFGYIGVKNIFAMAEHCPYGQVGDRLWVRETMWRNGGYVATDTPNINREGKIPAIFMKKIYARIWLEITGIRVERVQEISWEDSKAEGIRRDTIPACGDHPELECWVTLPDDNHAYQTPMQAFQKLWDSLNAKRHETIHHADGSVEHRQLNYGWEKNPWVWVLELKRISDVKD